MDCQCVDNCKSDPKTGKLWKSLWWAFGLYGFIALAVEAGKFLKDEKTIWVGFPDSMCLSLFKHTYDRTDNGAVLSNGSLLEYSYSGPKANVYVCTNDPKEHVASLIKSNAKYQSPSEFLGGCDPSDPNDYDYLIKHCTTKDTKLNCSTIIKDTTPQYTGLQWKYAALVTNGGDKCDFDEICLRDFSENVENGEFTIPEEPGKWIPCEQENVWAFYADYSYVDAILLIALFFELTVQFQLFCKEGDVGKYETVLGILYICKDEEPSGEIRAGTKLWMLICDCWTGYVSGLVVLIPCSITNNLAMFFLLIVKSIMVVNDVIGMCKSGGFSKGIHEIKESL